MSRYIDADKLCKGLKDMAKYQEPYKQSTILGVVSTIENASTADVVEVVRCKDCKFATEYCHGDFDCQCPHTPWASDEYAIPCKANDYCSYGERKEETK